MDDGGAGGRVGGPAECGGVGVEYVDPGRGGSGGYPDVVWRAARSLRAHSASHRAAP